MIYDGEENGFEEWIIFMKIVSNIDVNWIFIVRVIVVRFIVLFE